MKLYTPEILRLAQLPQPKIIENVTDQCTLSNPICGDRTSWQLCIQDGNIVAMSHQSKGCLLCKASANLIVERIQSGALSDVANRIDAFTMEIESLFHVGQVSGIQAEQSIFQDLRDAPGRKECVLLPWKALQRAISSSS